MITHYSIKTDKENIYFTINPRTGNWILSKDPNMHPSELDDCEPHKYLEDRIDMIILNTTSKCNLGCVYCSVGDGKKQVRDMDMSVGNLILDRVEEFGSPHMRFIFHGSEPLLNLPFIEDFSRECRSRSERNKQRYQLSIQTNATLIDEDVIDLFKRQGIEVSFSLDGLKEHQDSTRPHLSGKGSYSKVLSGIEQLRAYQAYLSPVTVVSSKNVRDLVEITQSFKDNGFSRVQYTLVQPTGDAKKDTSLLPNNNLLFQNIYKSFLMNLEWLREGDAFKIRNLTNILATFFFKTHPNSCSNCGVYLAQPIAIDTDGEMYPCDFWWGENGYSLGNIKDTSLKSALNSENNFRLLRKIEDVQNSDRMMFGKLHNNGCPIDSRAMHNDLLHETYYASYYKMIYESVAKLLPVLREGGLIRTLLEA